MLRSTLRVLSLIAPELMSFPDVSGFTQRTAAIKTYGRSKSSFIRNIKDAYAEGDTNILESFRVYFSDGSFVTYIDGPKSTDEKIAEKTAALGNNGYRVFIKTSLLKSGKLEKSEQSKSKNPNESTRKTKQGIKESTPPTKLTGASNQQQLEYELALMQERNLASAEKIESLTADKEFLKQELESRRDDIEDLKGLFQSIGNAADSTAKLQSGQSEENTTDTQTEEGTDPAQDSSTIEATATSVTAKNEDFWVKNTPNLPTLGKALSKLSKSFSHF